MKKETIDIDFRIKGYTKIETENSIRSFLSHLAKSPLPGISIIDITDKGEKAVSGYSDNLILETLNRELNSKKYPFVLSDADSKHIVSILPSYPDFSVAITTTVFDCDSDLLVWICDFMKKMILLFNPYFASIRLSSYNDLLDKYFEWERRTPYFTMFSWLNYFGPEEFRKQGGEAIFDNPYIKAERLGEGVLIQVGESPFDATTPEGEELIVKATRALPPVVK